MCDIWFLRFLACQVHFCHYFIYCGHIWVVGVNFKVKLNLNGTGRSCSEWVIHPTQIAIVSNLIFSEWVIWEQHNQSRPKGIERNILFKGKSKRAAKIIENDIISEVYQGARMIWGAWRAVKYNYWTGCSNLMCDTSLLMVFRMPYIYPFRATYFIALAHI